MKKPYAQLLPLLIWSFALACFPTAVGAATRTWDGGGGDGVWSTAANWTGDVVPATGDDVVITVASSVVVEFKSGTARIRSLQCSGGLTLSGGTLSFSGGASSVSGALSLKGGSLEISGAGASFTSKGAVSHTGSGLVVSGGASMRLAGLARISNPVNGNVSLYASDASSVLDLPDVTSAGVMDYYRLVLAATGGGRISLPKLSAMDGALAATADTGGAVVELPGFVGLLSRNRPGTSLIQARAGGTVLIPSVTGLDSVNLSLQGNGQVPTSQILSFTRGELTLDGVTNHFPALTNLDASLVFLSAKARSTITGVRHLNPPDSGGLKFQVSDAGTELSFPNLTNVLVNPYYRLELDAYGGARLSLPKLSLIDGPIDAYSDGVGSVVDLPALVGLLRNPKPGGAYVEARNGGSVLIPNVTSLDLVNLTLRGPGQTPTAQITSFTGADLTLEAVTNNFPSLVHLDGSSVYLSGKARASIPGLTQLIPPDSGSSRLQVSDAGSELVLPNVTTAPVNPYYRLQLYAYGGGRLALPKLSLIDGAIDAYSDGTGSVVDLPGLTGLLGNPKAGGAYIEGRNGGSVLIPNVTALDNINLTLRGSTLTPTSQLTSFSDAELHLDNVVGNFGVLSRFWNADLTLENQSQLALPLVTQLVVTNSTISTLVVRDTSVLSLPNVTRATIQDYYQLELYAYSGSRLELPKLSTVLGALDVYADGAGSVVDLSGIRGRLANTSPGQANIEARTGGTVLIPNVTEIDRYYLIIRGASQVSTAQLKRLTGSNVTVDGANVVFSHLTDTTDTKFDYPNGGTAVFQPPADLLIADIRGPAAAVANRPTEISWGITNRGVALTNGVWSSAVFLSGNAQAGGDLLLGYVAGSGDLGAGAVRRFTNQFVFPSSLAGSWWLVVAANQTRTVFEGTNYANNTNISATAMQIQAPDLVVDSVTLQPASAQLGSPVSVTWKVRNAGTAAATGPWVDRLNLATSPAGAVDLSVLAEEAITGDLAPGASYTKTRSVTVPFLSPPSAGQFVVKALADVGNLVPESSETNSGISSALTLTLPPLPDLAVTKVTAPASLTPGQSVNVSWVVTNVGNAKAVAPWKESVYLAASAQLSNRAPVATFLFTNDLAAGQSFARTQQVVLPVDLSAGATPVTVLLDSDIALPDPVRANNVASASPIPTVAAQLILRLPLATIAEDAPVPTLPALVTRNGDATSALTATLVVSDPSHLQSPASVSFRAGESSAAFNLTVKPDGVPTADRQVTVTVAATGYQPGSSVVTVQNSDVPRFALALSAATVTEGGVLTATLSHNAADKPAVTVSVTTTSNGRLAVPSTVSLPAGQSSITFPVTAVDDTRLDPTRTYEVQVSADGFIDAAASTAVVDNDLPMFALELAATSVSESAGIEATTGTVSRGIVSPRSLLVELENLNPIAVSIPASVTIPAGRASVSFPIAALNNALVDGPKTATLRAYALASTSEERVAQSGPVTITVTDDDGPALSLALGRELVGEGLSAATSLTVSRNTASTQPLVVALASSLPGEATVPASVTIPAGQASAAVPVATINDHVVDGSKRVQFTATASGFTSGSATLVVTDVMLPDLVVPEVTAPDTAETEAFVNLGYRVLNQGLAPAGTNWITRILLSNDPSAGGDTILADYAFNGTLPVGQYFSQSRQVRLPQAAGDYWIVVTTDVDGRIDEILKDNNTTVLSRPIHVAPAYSARVETDITAALAGTPVALRGSATNSSGGPASFVLVNIHIYLRGTHRVISALTDAQGRFTATFTPLAGEAGFYEIGAAHPGSQVAVIQDSFTLHGMKAQPVDPLRIAEGSSTTFQLSLENLGDRPLTGLTATVFAKPSNLNVTATLPPGGSVAGQGSVVLGVVIQALQPSGTPGDVILRVTSAEGVRLDIPINVTVDSLRARLVANPAELIAGMKVGGQALVDFVVSNEGSAPSDLVDIALPGVSWMQVATPNPMPSLAPGATNHILLQLRPAADLPLGAYEGSIVLSSGGDSVSVPYNFRALSEAKGDLLITTVDEYTFYAEGAPKVAGASVVVSDAVTTTVVASGLTDAAGQFAVNQLPEGYYEVRVSADKHSPFRANALVVAGRVNPFQAFPRREAVRYIWKVIPTEVLDRTRITIETVFEAFVPMPVITVDPPLIDLSEFTADVTQVDLKVENHGLIAAKEAKLSFGTHPDWSFEPLITELGDIPARSSFTIPLLIKRAGAGASARISLASVGLASGGGGCSVSGNCSFIVECGGGKLGGGAGIAMINASASGNCGGGGGGGGGGSVSGRPGGGGAGGGGPADSSDSGASCDGCAMAMAKAIIDCALDFVLNDALSCAKDTYSCVSGLSDGPSAGAAYACAKAVFSCAEAAGKKIPLVGALKYIDCAYGILTACDSLGGGAGGGGGGGGSGGGGGGGTPPAPTPSSLSLQGVRTASSSQLRIAALTLASNPDFTSLPASVQPLVLRMERAAKTFQPIIYLLGDDAWLRGETNDGFETWVAAFQAAIDLAGPGGMRISASERATLLSIARPATVSAQIVQNTLDRWNRSVDYWAAGVFNLAQVPAGQNADFIALDVWKQSADAALEAIAASKAEGYVDPLDALQKFGGEYLKFLSEGDGGGVCAHVRLRLDQQAIVTREGFKASLDIINDSLTELTDISVTVMVRRRDGRDATEFFAIKPPELSGVTAVDGTGVVALGATGSAAWTLVATTDVVTGDAEEFLVAGVLRYRQDGLNITVPLAPASIMVHPSPSLAVKYFHQRDVFADDPFTLQVEPSIPYSLAVMVQNKGRGTARDVRIDSAQPKIVDNQKGLLADFKIIATQVEEQSLTPSLSVEFGEIPPGTNAIGRWLLTSTILGGFIDYSATFEHLDGLGNKKLSLVEGVEIHELIHIVQATGNLDDGRPDFLVNDVPDLYDRPDTLHLSDGSTRPVAVVLDGSVDHAPSSGSPDVVLTAKLPPGFAYLRVPNPGGGKYRLVRAVRSDGTELPFGDNVWTTENTFLGNARRPLVESMLHLFDRDSTGQYTLTYSALPPGDTVAPVSFVNALPSDSSASIPVTWTGEDNAGGSGIQFFSIYASIDGAPYFEWQHETLNRSGVFVGALGKTYSFFSVATDNAGNREARHALADASTKVTRINHAPTLDPIADQVIKEGETFTLRPVAADPDGDELVFSLNTNLPPNVVIHPYTGVINWVTGEGSGGSETDFVLQVLDNGSPRLGAIRKFKVTVSSVNQAPTLSPIASRKVNEGTLLTITNVASDSDLPKQALHFSLGAGAPSGASIDANTGVFTWRPNQFQGGATNRITVVVTDDGVPTLSATQSFLVTVRDTLSDFSASLGTTNVLVGQSASVPLVLTSGADLSEVDFDLGAVDAHLANLTLEPIGGEILSAAFEPAGAGRYHVRVDFDSNLVQSGTRTVARLHFDTVATGHSSIARLQVESLAVTRADGSKLLNTSASTARVFLVEVEPLLDSAALGTQVRLTLYGVPGKRYMLQRRLALDGQPWVDDQLFTLTGTSLVVDRSVATSVMTYYRLVER